MDMTALRTKTQQRGNVLIVAIIGVMMAFSIVLWVSELSLRNFKTANNHMYQDEAFFAAQGTADAIAAEFDTAFKNANLAAKKLDPDKPLNFITWLDSQTKWSGLKQAKLPEKDIDPPEVSSMIVAEWTGKQFNGANINLARVTRTTTGTLAAGYVVMLRIEVEAAPADSHATTDVLTVSRLLSVSNTKTFKGGDFALLTENISCTFCHLTVSTMELKKKMEAPDILNMPLLNGDGTPKLDGDGNQVMDPGHHRRALVGTTKYLNTRFNDAHTEIHGTLYVGQGVTVADHGTPSTLAKLAKTGLKMAELHVWEQMESDNVTRATFKSNGAGNAILSGAPTVATDNSLKGQQLYDQYPGYGDYQMDKVFPSPFKDEGDDLGVGANNRRIDEIELLKTKSGAVGTLTAKHFTRVPYNTDEEYTKKNYTYDKGKLPDLDTGATPEIFKTGEKSNLILIGTKDNPIRIEGNVVIEGDVVIKGYIEGTGLLKASGNIYMPSDVMYNNKDVGTPNEEFAKSTTVGFASGGNIIIGDYISKVWGSNADFDMGKYDGGTPESNPNFVTYAAEQIAIYNREELTRTLKLVPGGGGRNLEDSDSFDQTNPVYDPNYTPRYYTMYPDTPAYAFIKEGGKGAKYDTDTKSWVTGEAPTSYGSHHMKIDSVPSTVKNELAKPYTMSIHPNWISPQNMLEIIGREERARLNDNGTGGREGEPFRVDGLLYTNNAIISIQRRKSQSMDEDGTWQEHNQSSHRGAMEINGSIISPDLGMLVTNGFAVNYDRRVRDLLNETMKTPDWHNSVGGFSRFNGPMTP